MKKKYVIIISAAVVFVVLLLIILNMSQALRNNPFSSQGSIGVIEVEDVILTSKTVVKDIKTFTEDPGIGAILLRIDSPGGGVAASQEIYSQVAKARAHKTVVVSMGSVAASGGLYIAMPANRIVANPSTVTGSIGVILEYPVVEELFRKIGIRYEVIKSKEHKDIGSPFRSLSQDERNMLEGVIQDMYSQFIDAIIAYRALTRDSLAKIADGRILTGRQALEFGLVDTLGSFEDAVAIAGNLIGVEKPNLIYPPHRFSLYDMLTKPMERMLAPKLMYLWH